MEKNLYPFKFIPVASKRPWGGNALVKELGKHFVEFDKDGNEHVLAADELIGESWEVADMGIEDSVIANGWLAGNTISEIMETYLERVVGENVYNYYGRQFPLLIKFLDIREKLSVQVHPDDEVAAERYDSLGKTEIWYVMDAEPGAKLYCGFSREVSAQEFYDRCNAGTVEEILNVVYPRKGDVLFITPGLVHAADGGVLVAEIQESSDMTFRLYDWGREFNPETARAMHLEEAIDIIDYSAFDDGLYRKGPLWGDEASYVPCKVHDCDCGGECHCHEEGHECHCHEESQEGQMIQNLVECPQFSVAKIALTDPLHIYTEKFESFIIYVCIEGAASIQVPSTDAAGKSGMVNYDFAKGETILVPADMPDFFLVPRDMSTILLEAVTRPVLEQDEYESPEDDLDEFSDQSGTNPLKFFS